MPEILAAKSPIPTEPFTPPGGPQAARVTIRSGPDLQLASIQFSPADRAAVQAVLIAEYGVEAPMSPHVREGRDGVRFIWSGLDQWLVCALAEQPDLIDTLRKLMPLSLIHI